MAKRPFMEMDLDDFEEKKDEGVIDEPSLDFDFDEDVEEITPDTDSLSETPDVPNESNIDETNASKLCRAQFKDKSYFDEYITKQRKRIEKISSTASNSPDSIDSMLSNMYMNLISAEYSDGMSKEEMSDDVKKMFSHIKTVDSYAAMVDYLSLAILFNINGDEISNVLSNNRYDDDLVSKLKEALGSSASGEGVKYESYKAFDDMLNDKISSEEFLNYVNNDWYEDSKDRYWYDSHNSNENTYTGYWCWVGAAVAQIKNIDASGSKYIPSELINSSQEVTQEGVLTNGIGRIRNELAKALAGKYVVSNLNPKTDEFNIKERGGDFNSPTTYCTPTNNGLKVVTRGVGIPMKPHFSSIPLSQAFEKIKALFDKPELLTAESYVTDKAVTKFPYPSRFFQEAEEESTDDEEPEIPEMPDFGADDTDNEGDDSGEVEVTAEVEEKITPEGEDLSSFGMDTSDVQNDFDQKDVDSLNKLIAAESEAINDYFDASKDTRNEDLRTLFSDIGHEERFHLEQLMYSKAKLTGEKYEPRDPKVKEEYEELINGGMDEDTAAYTAMDKASMLPDDDGDDSDMEELEQESALICNMLYNNELLVSICEHCVSNDTITRDKNVAMFVEGYIMESIDNVSSAPKEMTKIKSPFSILAKGLGVAIAGLAKMSSIARDSMRRSNLKRARRKEWIQKHGITDLFKAGISLYLYNDKTSTMDFNTPCRYIDFLYRLTKAIGETCGVQLTQAAKHKSVPDPIKFTSVKEGMYKLSQVVFTKTKVVVTDANKTALQNEFFGYNDNKLNVAVTHGTDQVVRDSANIYNRLDAMILIIKQYAEISKAVLDQLSKLEGDVNSVYYKNRPVYNKAKDNMTEVIKKYNQFISATSHDLNQIMKLDNGLLKMTRERDMTEQGGGKWEGPDIRVNPKTQPQDPKYTQMKKKKGLFH